MTSTSERRHVTAGSSRVHSIYSALIGVSAFAILLQGVWAGLFIGHQGEGWVEIHAVGGEVAIAFAAVASILVIWKLRSRRDLLVGTLLVTLLLIVEAYLGGAHRRRAQGRSHRRTHSTGDGTDQPRGVAAAQSQPASLRSGPRRPDQEVSCALVDMGRRTHRPMRYPRVGLRRPGADGPHHRGERTLAGRPPPPSRREPDSGNPNARRAHVCRYRTLGPPPTIGAPTTLWRQPALCLTRSCRSRVDWRKGCPP